MAEQPIHTRAGKPQIPCTLDFAHLSAPQEGAAQGQVIHLVDAGLVVAPKKPKAD